MQPDTLARILKRTQRRVMLTVAVQRAGVGLVFGAIGGLAVVGLDRTLDANWPWWVAIATCALGAAIGFFSSFVRPPATDDVAVLLDRALGLKDRIGTADAINRGRVRGDVFTELVRRDAARVAAGIAPASIIPWRLGRPWLFAVVLVAAVAASNAFLPSLAWSRTPTVAPSVEEIAAIDAAQREVASTLDEFTRESPTDDSVPSERSREQFDRLAELAQQLQEAPQADPETFRQSRDEAAATLRQLADEREREAARARESTRQLTERFERLTPPTEPTPTNELERALREGDFGRAAQLLEQLDRATDELSPADRAAASERLREIADALRESAGRQSGGAPDELPGDDSSADRRERELRDALRSQGLDEEAIDRLFEGEEPLSARELAEEGVDPEAAQSLARELDAARQAARAKEDAERRAEELSRRFETLADEVESNPRQDQTPNPSGEDESSPEATDPTSQEQSNSSDRGQEQEESATQAENERSAEERASETETKQEGSDPTQTNSQQQQQQQSGEQSQSSEQQQQQQQQQSQQGQQGSESTVGEGDQQKSSSTSTNESNQQGEAGTEQSREGSAGEQQQEGGQSDQQGEQAAGQQAGDQTEPDEKTPAGAQGEHADGSQPASEDSQQDQAGGQGEPPSIDPSAFDPENLPSADELRRLLQEMDRQQQSGESAEREAERMRQAAQEIAEKLTPEERERLKQWAEQMQQELGESANPEQPLNEEQSGGSTQSDSGTQPGGSGLGEDEGAGRGATGNRSRTTPDRLNPGEGESLDLRGSETTNRTLAEIFDQRRSGEPTSTDQATPGVVGRDAKRAAEQAVSNATIHRRYHELIRRYFDRLPQTLDEAAKSRTNDSADQTNSEQSASDSGGSANEDGSSR